MQISIKILVGVLCIPLLLIVGSNAMFLAKESVETFGLQTTEIYGYNSFRSIVGGLLLSSTSMILIGLLKNNTTWFLATILIMLTVVFGRVFSFIVDGYSEKAIMPLIAEIVIIGVLAFAHFKSKKNS